MDKRNGETKEKKSNEFDRALIINDYIKHQVTSLDEKIKALKQQYKEIGDNLSKAKRDRNDLKTYKSQMLFILNRPSNVLFNRSLVECVKNAYLLFYVNSNVTQEEVENHKVAIEYLPFAKKWQILGLRGVNDVEKSEYGRIYYVYPYPKDINVQIQNIELQQRNDEASLKSHKCDESHTKE